MLTPPLFTRFGGVNTFDDNWGFLGGAIYNGVDATIAFPEDGGEVIFQNLRGEVGDIDGDFVFHFVVATFYLLQIGSIVFCVLCDLSGKHVCCCHLFYPEWFSLDMDVRKNGPL